MTHYAHVTTPWGNFALSATTPDDQRGEVARYALTPIGELDRVPTTSRPTIGETIDTDALEVEARRQLAARGAEPAPYLTPRPEYTINRAIYTAELAVRVYNEGRAFISAPYAIDAGLTEAAERKVAQWWADNHDSILTPRFLAESELDRAKNERMWAERHVAEARRVLDEREAALAAADDRISAANAALDALDREAR